MYLNAIEPRNEDVDFIDKRAWTMQEHFLATRLTKFGTRQTEWICPTSRHMDGGNDLSPQDRYPVTFYMSTRTHIPSQERPDLLNYQNDYQTSYLSDWMILLQECSERRISYHDNRLPGLPASAHSLGIATG